MEAEAAGGVSSVGNGQSLEGWLLGAARGEGNALVGQFDLWSKLRVGVEKGVSDCKEGQGPGGDDERIGDEAEVAHRLDKRTELKAHGIVLSVLGGTEGDPKRRLAHRTDVRRFRQYLKYRGRGEGASGWISPFGD